MTPDQVIGSWLFGHAERLRLQFQNLLNLYFWTKYPIAIKFSSDLLLFNILLTIRTIKLGLPQDLRHNLEVKGSPGGGALE